MASEYVTQPGDSLPSIAEACGHPGEWQLIVAWNAPETIPDPNNIQPGMTIVLPDLASWPAPGDPEATSTDEKASSTRSSSSSSSSSSGKNL
jgi:LysM repeat protein